MILYDDSFLTNEEIKFILDKWNDSLVQFSKVAIHFYFIDFVKHKIKINELHNGEFSKVNFEKIRLQKYNSSFNQIVEYHGHENHHNYILFLNDDFIGGELEFENGLVINPKRGALVYFNNHERHRVLPCKGDRYVFTLLGNYPVKLNFKHAKKSIL